MDDAAPREGVRCFKSSTLIGDASCCCAVCGLVGPQRNVFVPTAAYAAAAAAPLYNVT